MVMLVLGVIEQARTHKFGQFFAGIFFKFDPDLGKRSGGRGVGGGWPRVALTRRWGSRRWSRVVGLYLLRGRAVVGVDGIVVASSREAQGSKSSSLSLGSLGALGKAVEVHSARGGVGGGGRGRCDGRWAGSRRGNSGLGRRGGRSRWGRARWSSRGSRAGLRGWFGGGGGRAGANSLVLEAAAGLWGWVVAARAR